MIQANSVRRTYKDIQDGRIVVSAKQLPRFLFPHDHLDEISVSDGVFQGYLMIRVSFPHYKPMYF